MKILLADDHTLVRQGIRRMLEEEPDWTVVGEAGDGLEVLRMADELKPDLAIVDVAMPHLNGIEAIRRILQKQPRMNVLVLSMHADESYVTQTLHAGARGYMLKDSADADLFEAVRTIATGGTFLSPAIARQMSERVPWTMGAAADPYDTLTNREREVFQLVAEARSNRDIASLLGISVTTVETHRARVLNKLSLHNAAEIALYALRRGVIK